MKHKLHLVAFLYIIYPFWFIKSGADPGFDFHGGGGAKDYVRERTSRAPGRARSLLRSGVQGSLKGHGSSRGFDALCAIWAFLIQNGIKIHSLSNFRGRALVAPPLNPPLKMPFSSERTVSYSCLYHICHASYCETGEAEADDTSIHFRSENSPINNTMWFGRPRILFRTRMFASRFIHVRKP